MSQNNLSSIIKDILEHRNEIFDFLVIEFDFHIIMKYIGSI
jgi:hypothetical protein